MDRTRTFDRLPELSTPVRDALARALEHTAAGGPENEETDLYRTALIAAGIATGIREKDATTPWRDPGALSAEQRVVLEILAELDRPQLGGMCVPRTRWVRRQWLGLDPPGPIFTIRIDGRPAYVALHALGFGAQDAIARLPTDEAIPLAVDLQLSCELGLGNTIGNVLTARGAEVGPSLGPWARATADRIIALFAAEVPASERGGWYAVPAWVALPVFLALARARIPIEPRWEPLFPAAPWITPDVARACVEALAPGRRDDVVSPALARIDAPVQRAPAALTLLSVHPTAALTHIVLDAAARTKKPGDIKKAVKALAATHAAVADALRGPSAPAAPALTVAAVRERPTLDALDAIDRAQLVRANELYGGKRQPIEALYDESDGGPERIRATLLRHLRIEQDGRHAYDAWLYMGDSGTIFAARTERVVAEIVQTHLQGGDPPLHEALRAVIAAAGPGKAKKPTAKKPAAKKPAAKKPRS